MDRIQALREQRAKLMADASAILQGENLTTEHRTQADKMFADVDVIEADLAREERIAKFQAEQRTAPRPPREQVGVGNGQKEEHRSALRNFILKGETRDILTTDNGKPLLQPEFYPELVTALKSYGALANVVEFMQTETGNDMKIPLYNDLARGLTPIAENAPITRRDPVISLKTSAVEKFETQEIYLTNEQMTDSYFSLENFLTENLLEAYYRGVNQLVTEGSPSGKIESIVNTAAVGAVAASQTAITYDDLIALYGAADTRILQNSSWVLSSKTRAQLMAIKLTTGEPLLTSANSGNFTELLGRPMVVSEFMPDVAAGDKSLLLGDLKRGYTLRQVGNISIRRLNELYARQDAVSFYGIVRLSGFSKNPGGAASILALKQAA